MVADPGRATACRLRPHSIADTGYMWLPTQAEPPRADSGRIAKPTPAMCGSQLRRSHCVPTHADCIAEQAELPQAKSGCRLRQSHRLPTQGRGWPTQTVEASRPPAVTDSSRTHCQLPICIVALGASPSPWSISDLRANLLVRCCIYQLTGQVHDRQPINGHAVPRMMLALESTVDEMRSSRN